MIETLLLTDYLAFCIVGIWFYGRAIRRAWRRYKALDAALREARALREASQRRYITEQGAYR